MVTSVVMITMYTGVGLNTDIEKGVFDRFRTLPVWRPAALVGMIFGDVLRYILAATTIIIVGLILGFRPAGGVIGVCPASACWSSSRSPSPGSGRCSACSCARRNR